LDGRESLRLDLFLKYSCLVPRRTVAKRLCDSGQVFINHHAAKASAAVTAGDTLEIFLGSRKRTVKILEVPAGQVAKKIAPSLYLLTGDSVVQD
jgi:ribosomal 50S subunit-recycling heat shock protein